MLQYLILKKKLSISLHQFQLIKESHTPYRAHENYERANWHLLTRKLAERCCDKQTI